MRECNGCTVCCEGWVKGTSHGHVFQPGRPCHFMCETGCSIYDDRPKDPCINYTCEWLINPDIPEWMKPNLSKVIINRKIWNNNYYLHIAEAGKKIDSQVLNWLFHYHYVTNIPISVQVSGGWTNYGPPEFLKYLIDNDLINKS